MKSGRNSHHWIKGWGGKLYILSLLVIVIYPIIWMILCSFKTPAEISLKPMFALPESFYLKNYFNAWYVGKMNIFIRNSAISTFTALMIVALFAIPAAFAIQIMKWKLSKFVLTVFTSGIMIPVYVVLLPLLIIYKKIGMTNSLLGLSLTYAAFGLPLAIYLFVGYFHYIPKDILESAFIDGCDIYSLLLRIIFPLMKNIILTVLTLQFVFNWNDLILSMTLINKVDLKTIQSGLLIFSNEYGDRDWGAIFAAITMGFLPTMLLYIVLNKLIVRGMTSGAVKG
jgi:raffinose/stachyose/melibiose transport system permease protein